MPDFLSFTARVIDLSNGKAHVAESCLEETGGLGVDIVLDAGGGHFTKSVVSVISVMSEFQEKNSQGVIINIFIDV